MSAPTIEIEFDPGPWTDESWKNFRPTGGEIAGRVRVSAQQNVGCRGIHVEVGWRTEGRGDTDSEALLNKTVHSGEFPAGQQEFPFRLQLPAGPISYDGKYIKIVWYAQARIDLAWKRDPKAEKQFLVTLP